MLVCHWRAESLMSSAGVEHMTCLPMQAARAEERKRAKRMAEEAQEVTYKVIKSGSGTWKKWETVTEKVAGGMSREDMLQKRINMKADRFCK